MFIILVNRNFIQQFVNQFHLSLVLTQILANYLSGYLHGKFCHLRADLADSGRLLCLYLSLGIREQLVGLLAGVCLGLRHDLVVSLLGLLDERRLLLTRFLQQCFAFFLNIGKSLCSLVGLLQ